MLVNKRNLLKLVSVITIMMLSIFMLAGCGKKENENENKESETAYLQPLTDYFEGVKNKDINQVLKAFPDFAKMSEKITSEDINTLYSQYESLYGANIKLDYSLGEAVALSEEEVTELENEISSLYSDIENLDITAAYTVPVTVTITGDGIQKNTQNTENTENTENAENTENTENTENAEETINSNVEEDIMYVIQYNGNWYTL